MIPPCFCSSSTYSSTTSTHLSVSAAKWSSHAATAGPASGLGGSCIHLATSSNCQGAGMLFMRHTRLRWLQHACLCSCSVQGQDSIVRQTRQLCVSARRFGNVLPCQRTNASPYITSTEALYAAITLFVSAASSHQYCRVLQAQLLLCCGICQLCQLPAPRCPACLPKAHPGLGIVRSMADCCPGSIIRLQHTYKG
jgi:hypothetical protein